MFENLSVELGLDSSGFEKGIENARDSVDGLADRAQKTGKSMQSAGKKMSAGLTAPIAGAGVASAKFAADFDQSMQKSIAVMGDVSDSMRSELEATARDVATNMAVSHDEAAESFFFLASAGLDAAESIEAMPQVAALAEAGQLDMAQATDVATNVMSAYGKEASELNEVTDILVATNTRHNQSVEDMADAFSMVAPTAAGMGIEMDELAAAVGQLGDVGLDGQRAGTALNTVISQMADESGPAATAMEEMGVSVTNAEGDMRPLVDIIRDFEEAGASAGDMARIFGTRGGPAMSALLDQGADALEENTGALNELEGVTQDVADTQRDTLNAQLNILRSNFRDAGIVIGQNLLPPLVELTNRLRPLAESFQNLSDRQQRLIIIVGAAVAAIGPLLLAFGTFLTLVPAMVAGAGAVGTAITLMTGPFGIAVLAIAALAAAFATDFMGIRTLTEDVVADIIGFLQPFLDLLGVEFLETLTVWRNAGSDALSWFEDRWDEHGETVMAIIEPFLIALETAFEVAFAYVEFVVKSALDALVTIVRVGLAILRGDFAGAFDIITGFLDRQVDRFKKLGSALIDAFTDGIMAVASKPVDAIKDIAGNVRDQLPMSDAKEGPFADLTASGESLPETFAEGVSNTSDAPAAATQEMAGTTPLLSATGDSASGGASGDITINIRKIVTEDADSFANDLHSAMRGVNLDRSL